MKLSVLTDQSGNILAAHYDASPTLPLPPPSPRTTSRIRPAVGQSLHEVAIPVELQRHILENTLATEIFKYRVERHGEAVRLIKIS